jgi:putative ABC transport system permease protein
MKSLSFYLSLREVWRDRGRFTTFSLVIALITLLVLFVAGLGEGLATANKEYLEKLDAQLLVFQEDTDLSTTASRIARSKLSYLSRVPGVEAVGPIGFANASVVFPEMDAPLDIALIGVEPGQPGEPAPLQGGGLGGRSRETVIDEDIAAAAGLDVGDTLVLKTIQGTEDEFFELTVVGITSGQQYFFQPSLFVRHDTWDDIRPQPNPNAGGEEITNIMAVRLENPDDWESMIPQITAFVDGIETADIVTAYESGPGYSAQQTTLNTQQGFTLLISVLVIGGFFQIQTLQKVPQIGMLKAIGASNRTVAAAVLVQIVLVTGAGILIGGLVTFLLSLGFPPSIPIIFSGQAIAIAIGALLVIGPVGGMVAIRLALRVEPLTALGLGS